MTFSDLRALYLKTTIDLSLSAFQYHQSCKVTIEMLDTETESQDSEKEEESVRKHHTYVDRFIQPGATISDECRTHLARYPCFLPRSIRSHNTSPYGAIRSEKVKEPSGLSGPSSAAGLTNGGGGGGDNGVVKKEEDIEDKTDSVYNEDNTSCVFGKNQKLLFVLNSENCFYRKLALTRGKNSHKAVSRRKHADFGRWHAKWAKSHVTDAQRAHADDWFMGRCEGLVPNKTHKITRADQDKSPYRTYHKYKSELIKSSGSSA